MDWFYPKRRGPEWKQGWTSQTINSMSVPPFHLIAVFAIVVVLLWLSQYTGYKAQVQQTSANLQVFLLSLPLLLILFMVSYSTAWLPDFRLRRPHHEPLMSPAVVVAAGNFPWGVAVFVVVLLVLLSYQSSFHSKWFGAFRGSD